ncbi:hypothetical protein IFR05_013437 [Cadophora sp. M221]|nr:hypothetical protein IFR05_013437 [Cadophora sp. M221]
MEYMIDHRHIRDVLTDAKNYSFVTAVLKMLNMELILWFKNGTFVEELDKLVHDGITPRLHAVIERISPIFNRESNDIWLRTKDVENLEIDDMFEWVHHAIAQAMVILILGEEYLDTAMTQKFTDVVASITELTGIYENMRRWRYFPGLWSFKIAMKAIIWTMVPKYFFGIVPQVWKNKESHLDHGVDVEKNEYSPLLDPLVAKHRDKGTNKLSFSNSFGAQFSLSV